MLITGRKGGARVIGICKCFGFLGLKPYMWGRAGSDIAEYGWNQNLKYLVWVLMS